MIAVVDTGGANLASVTHALARLKVEARLTSDAQLIRGAKRVILPGVGAAAASMQQLRRNGLDRVIPRLEQPVLGICLGMQLLFEGSDEGDVACLGILPGRVRALRPAPGISVPHMGWNRLRGRRADPLLADVPADAHVYFVHGFACPDGEATVADVEHGTRFPAICRRGNFIGVQFHPERSGVIGARILRSFVSA